MSKSWSPTPDDATIVTRGCRLRKLVAAVVLSVVFAVPAAASAARLPTELWGVQRRPFVVSWTGDSTGYLGGPTGRRGVTTRDIQRRGLRANFGRLRWTTWNATQGRAWGVNWLNNCKPNCARGTFFPKNVNVRVYRPNSSGIFTRLEILSKRNRVQTRRFATRQFGHWIWGV